MKKLFIRFGKIITCSAVSIILHFQAKANTYTVSNNNDDGTGSLREAIVNANANPGTDIISFSTSGTITLSSVLPLITGPVAINGYTAPGASQGAIGSRSIAVTINGGNSTSTSNTGGRSSRDGLFRFTAAASGSSLSGLSIVNTGNSVEAIVIEMGSNNIHIWGNYIGLNATGVAGAATVLRDDAIVIGDYDVTTSTTISNITIGTDGNGTNDINEGNAIGNTTTADGGDGIQVGVDVVRAGLSNVRIAGNYIGMAANGTTTAPTGTSNPSEANDSGKDGISITSVNGTNVLIGTDGNGVSDVLESNLISGNCGNGIGIASSNGIYIAGNLIGTDKTGTLARPNGTKSAVAEYFAGIAVNIERDGSLVKQASSNIIIGFDDTKHTAANATAARNIISGNQTVGIDIYDVPYSGQTNTVKISGNYIGVSASGNTRLGNGQGADATDLPGNGIAVADATNITIGTDGDGSGDNVEGNIISGAIFGRGIKISSTGTATGNSIIAGNYIGTGANGTTAIGNDGPGIEINTATNVRIGSDDNGTSDVLEANIIANNAKGFSGTSTDGLRILGTSTRIRVSRNSFYNNSGTPIDLVNDGVTLNDGATTSGQPNILLDYPVITGFSVSGTSLNVAGYLSSCSGSENTAGTAIAGVKTIQFYKVADDGDQNAAVTNGACSRVTSHGEGIQYLGSISGVVNSFNTSFSLVAGASFADGDQITAIAIDANGNTSEFGVTTITNALPVIFSDVTAIFINGQLRVDWTTNSEKNNSHFEIETSADGKNFAKISEVKTQAENGDSSVSLHYRFSHAMSKNALQLGGGLLVLSALVMGFRKKKLVSAIVITGGLSLFMAGCTKKDSIDTNEAKIFVRIVQVDKDGARSYSKIIKVTE